MPPEPGLRRRGGILPETAEKVVRFATWNLRYCTDAAPRRMPFPEAADWDIIALQEVYRHARDPPPCS